MRKGQKVPKCGLSTGLDANQVPASGFVWPTAYRNSKARVRLAHLPAKAEGSPVGNMPPRETNLIQPRLSPSRGGVAGLSLFPTSDRRTVSPAPEWELFRGYRAPARLG